jgi:hypothetical protein
MQYEYNLSFIQNKESTYAYIKRQRKNTEGAVTHGQSRETGNIW